MTPDDERAARLRRLQERRASAPTRAAAGEPTAADPIPGAGGAADEPEGSGSTDGTVVPASGGRAPAPPRRRRRHAAPAGRVLAAGLSASAFLGAMAAMDATAKTSWGSTGTGGEADPAAAAGGPGTTTTVVTEPPVPPTVVVVQEVHHPVYVDELGNPISGGARPASTPQAATASRSTGSAPSPTASTPASPAPSTAPTTAPPPPPPPPPPPCSGSAC